MARILRLCILGLAVVASTASFGPGDDPEPDSCASGTLGSLTSIELGHGTSDDLDPFELVEDGATVEIIRGFQGASMYSLRFRAVGSDVPECAQHQSRLYTCAEGAEFCDRQIAQVDDNLKTYGSGESGTTKNLFMILNGRVEAELRLVTTFGSLSREWRVIVRQEVDPDPDAADPDAEARCALLGTECGGCDFGLECFQGRCLGPLNPPVCNTDSSCDGGFECLARFDSQTGGFCVPADDYDCICENAPDVYLGCADSQR